MSELFNFAALTIFARECLEGSIIIGEYRTIILKSDCLAPGIQQSDALQAVNVASALAAIVAVLLIVAVAVPLALLSSDFNPSTSYIIEGISKIVASVALLQLSLQLPKFLGVYARSKSTDHDGSKNSDLTLRNIRFNVAWNIWREVAECGVFLIPIFLNGEEIKSIPLSAAIGSFVGLLCGYGIYVANIMLKKKVRLAFFVVIVLVFLSAGLFAGGCRRLENEIRGEEKIIWQLDSDFWSVNRLPMTLLKPFGYNSSRTLLEIVSYWTWLGLSLLLHLCKYRNTEKEANTEIDEEHLDSNDSKDERSEEADFVSEVA